MREATANRGERSGGDIVTSNPDWIWETDSEGRYTYSNERVEEILGYRVDEIIGAHVLDVVDPREGPEIAAILTGATRDRAPFANVAKRARGKDGREVWLETSGVPLLNDTGVLTGYRGIDRDVTRRQRLLERLRRAVRSTTAGCAAHRVATGVVSISSPRCCSPDCCRSCPPDCERAAPRCVAVPGVAAETTQPDLAGIGLARREPGPAEPINLNRTIGEALSSLGPVPTSLRVETRLARDLLPISGSPAQIGRVVGQLLSDARQALADRGSIALKTENVYVDEPVGSHNPVDRGEYVRLEVSSTGTSRTPWLGPSLVEAIVERHDGYVDVAGETDGRTRVGVYLPVDRDVLREAHGEGMDGGTETILVVDDDVDQRELICRGLESLGYRVRTVVSGEEAVAYVSRRDADLVILDMVMPPGIDGTETYRRIRQRRPGQRAIIVSGCAESDRTRAAQALGAGAYLRKPVTLSTLARAIRRELDRG